MEFATLAKLHEADDITQLSPRDFSRWTKSLKQARSKRRLVESLQKIAANFVIRNFEVFSLPKPNLFLDYRRNAFVNLPHLVVQELLSRLEEFCNGKVLDSAKLCLLLQLLNTQVTEFDLNAFDWTKKIPVGCRPAIFRHLLENCPKIKSVVLNEDVWDDCGALPLVHQDHLFTLMASRWPNLSYLNLESMNDGYDLSYSSDDKKSNNTLIPTICTNLPNLRGLKFHLRFKHFSSEDLDLLSKMKYLEELDITCDCKNTFLNQEEFSTLVRIAGSLPHLKNFGYSLGGFASNHDDSYPSFIRAYARAFPGKKLCLNNVLIQGFSLKEPWPAFVSVRDLFLKNLCSFDNENILAIEGPVLKLSIENWVPQYIYPLVEKLGPTGITHLDIKIEFKGEDQRLDLCRVLAPCQNLVHVDINVYEAFCKGDSLQKLMPIKFRKCEHFEIHVKHQYYEVDEDLVQTLKMYLLGSKVHLKTLQISSVNEFRAVQLALEEAESEGGTTCLDRLQEIRIIFHKYPSAALNGALQAILLLYNRSPFLQNLHVTYKTRTEDPPAWFAKLVKGLGLKYKEDHNYRIMPVFDDYPSSDEETEEEEEEDDNEMQIE